MHTTDRKICSYFEQLGLSNYEARVYLFLLRNGQSYGNEISKNTGIPSSKIYETLSRLVEKGLAHLIQTKPIRYQALPLKEFLSQWQADATRTLKFLMDNENLIETKPQSELLWHISGRKEIMEKVKEIIDSAENTILISLWPDDALELKANLRMAHQRKVQITSIQYGDKSLDIGRVYKHLNTSTVNERHGSELFILADRKKGLFLHFENSKGWVGYYSSSPGIARVIENYIRHDIYTNKLIEDHYEVVVRSYGKDMSGLINFD